MKKFEKCLKKFVLYLCETYKNKLCALALLIAGWIPLKISGDGTALMNAGIFATLEKLPLNFKKNGLMMFSNI